MIKIHESEKDSLKSWLIFFQVCLNGSLLVTQLNAYSLIYIELMDYFGFNSAQAQFLPSVYMGMRLVISPLIIQFIQRLGYRWSCVIGTLFVAISNFLNFFSFSYFAFLITIGIIPMLSISLIMIPNLFIIKDILKRHLRKGFALYFTAFSLSNMMTQYLFSYFIEKYTIRGAFLMLSAFQLNGILPTFFFPDSKEVKQSEHSTSLKSKLINTFQEFWRASRNLETILFYLAFFFASISANTGYILIMDNAHLYHYDKNLILFLPVLEDIISIPIRLFAGALFDWKPIKPFSYIIYSGFILIFSTSHLVNSFARYGYGFLVVTMALRAIGKGVFISQLVLPCSFLAETDSDVPLILSMGQSFRGAGVFIGNIISGHLKDHYGDYQPSLYFLWTTHFFGGLLYIISSCSHYHRTNREKVKEVCLLGIQKAIEIEERPMKD